MEYSKVVPVGILTTCSGEKFFLLSTSPEPQRGWINNYNIFAFQGVACKHILEDGKPVFLSPENGISHAVHPAPRVIVVAGSFWIQWGIDSKDGYIYCLPTGGL